jgi:hypothetical protein
MRVLLVATLAAAACVPASAGTVMTDKARAPVQGRGCPTAALQRNAGEAAVMRKLNELPPAETFAAVYYLDGCPRRLIEAQGRKRR